MIMIKIVFTDFLDFLSMHCANQTRGQNPRCETKKNNATNTNNFTNKLYDFIILQIVIGKKKYDVYNRSILKLVIIYHINNL